MVESKQLQINSNAGCKQDVKIQLYKRTHMNWKGFGRKRYYSGIFCEGLRYLTNNSSQDCQCSDYAYRYDNPLCIAVVMAGVG
jgi:hypothetical protein